MFAAMSVADARALHGRLTCAAAADELAQRFGRFVLERRLRLIAFVADARRREALAAASARR